MIKLLLNDARGNELKFDIHKKNNYMNWYEKNRLLVQSYEHYSEVKLNVT